MKQYPDYLVHYNKNHSKSNGQFVSGDGDGDGVTNDHANQKKQLTPEEKKRRAKRNAWIAVGAAAAGTAVAAAALIITKNHSKKMADQAEKARLGKSFINATKISSTPLLEATSKTSRDNKEFKNLSKGLNDAYKDYKKSVQNTRYMNIKFNNFGKGENKYSHLSKDLNSAYSEYREAVNKFRKKG